MPTFATTDNPFGDTAVAVYKRTIPLTDVQIKDLPNTPIELLPAPGVGKLILVTNILVRAKLLGAYTNVDAADSGVIISYNNGTVVGSADFQNSADTFGAGNLLGFVQDIWYSIECSPTTYNGSGIPTVSGYNISNTENKNITVSGWNGSGNDAFIGGNAGNTLEITIDYSIVDL